MLKFRIHYTVNGFEDSIIITGDTLEEIRDRAITEVSNRGGTDPWSEEIS